MPMKHNNYLNTQRRKNIAALCLVFHFSVLNPAVVAACVMFMVWIFVVCCLASVSCEVEDGMRNKTTLILRLKLKLA